MASRDLHSNVKAVPALTPREISADETVAGAIVDTDGFESVEFVFAAGVLTTGTYAPSFEHGDAANLSDTAAVPASALIGTVASVTFAATDDGLVKRIGYRGGKRYIRASLTSAGTASGFIGAVAILGNAEIGPVP